MKEHSLRLFSVYFAPDAIDEPYGNQEAYMQDLYSYLDMSLAYACAFRLQRELSIESDKNSLETESYSPPVFLREKVTNGIFTSLEEELFAFHNPGSSQIDEKECLAVRKDLLIAKTYMMKRLVLTPGMGKEFCIMKLIKKFALSKLEQFLLLMSMTGYHSAKYQVLFSYLQGDAGIYPTLRLAFALYEMAEDISEEEKAGILSGQGNLFRFLLDYESSPKGSYGESVFTLSKRVFTFLMGRNMVDPDLKTVGDFFSGEEELQPVCVRREWVDKIRQIMETYAGNQTDSCMILHLFGESGNGRRFGVRHGARACGFSVLFIEVCRIISLTVQEISILFKSLEREYHLADLVLCFLGPDFGGHDFREDGMFPPSLDYLLSLIAGNIKFCIWISDEKSEYLFPYPIHVLTLESRMLTVRERISLWEEMSRRYILEKHVDLVLCANKYILTAKSISEVLSTSGLLAECDGRTVISQSDILAAVKQRSCNQLGRYAHLIDSVFTWHDLQISETQKRQMEMICAQVKYRSVVGEEWGFYKKMPYGRGICALFYGAPGTGKTMAVQVIANELGLDLYRVDLSQMISKYFGETQKNISALFQKAKNINALLFFDEADSMFAKRSEVRGSHDRSANAETAHLLQKLEEYEGVTILATNYVNNIDDAFRRRIKFMVEFTFPSQEVRHNLWKSMLPEKVILEEELDLEFYAKKFELSGSSIKEIVTNAAFTAASEKTGIANRHLVEAIKMNFAKYGKNLTINDFGYLLQTK